MSSEERKLTPKQERFCEEYLIDLNGAQAAVRAGYSDKGANVTGSKLLANPSISARIAEGRQKQAQKAELTAEWVLNHLVDCVRMSKELEEVQKWDYEQKCMIGTGRMIYDSKGATKALELIGKHLGMYKTDISLSGNVAVKIIDDVADEDPGE